MCGRFTLTKSQEEIEARFDARFKEIQNYRKWNAAPGNAMPVIVGGQKGAIQMFKWGLVPSWARDEKIGYKTINARMETVVEKPAFRHAYQYQRCVVLADGYYEWKTYGQDKIPYRITLKDGGLFAMAGLWEKWEGSEGQPLHTFTILTRPAIAPLAFIHDRMPVILNLASEPLWLLDQIPASDLQGLLDNSPHADGFHYYTVSKKVNRTSENSSDLIAPFKHNIQGSLF